MGLPADGGGSANPAGDLVSESAPAAAESAVTDPGRARRRRRRRIALRVMAIGVGLLVLAEITGLLLELRQAKTYPKYWADQAAEPVAPQAVRLVVFGDSAGVGIGAWKPEDSVVGRIAGHLQERTGRPVHVANYSVGGGTFDSILTGQLQRADVARADVVVVIAGSNDTGAKVPLDTYRANVTKLLEALPADRTVLSDVPLQRGRDNYQRILAELSDARGVAHADFAGAFRSARRLDVWAPDFTHVNSVGYRIWFQAFRPHLDTIAARL
ncbi:SGNH/GDSL hydrolase family protein [Kribbella sp. NPDC050124]|uniref:SGNH/GDSL hydrolase family protein n=1 Tax=Kribbella sp. NPDC050124 TaxID=3364114 RepID=UPI0037A1174D